MTDREIIKALGELAKIAPTAYLFDVCKNAISRLRDIDLLKSSYESRFFKIKKAIILVEKKDMVK